MHESSYDDCGCCADVHFGALLNQTSRLIRRALDARINAEVSSELSGVRGMVLGDIVRAERQGRDVYQRDIEQWFNIRRSSVTAMLQGMEQDGFITRSAVAKDARLKRLIATEKGRACHKQIEASIARCEDDLHIARRDAVVNDGGHQLRDDHFHDDLRDHKDRRQHGDQAEALGFTSECF